MASSTTRIDGPNLSISTMISTSCVMLENLHEFNPHGSIGECGYFPDYSQQVDDSVLEVSADRDPDQTGMAFESEATPFSQESYLGTNAHPEERINNEYGTSFFTPLTTQNDYADDITKATFSSGVVNVTASVNQKLYPSARLEQRSTILPRPEDAYLQSNDGSGRLESDHESQFAIADPDKDVLTVLKYPRDVPCIRGSLRQSTDWPSFSQTASTFDSNTTRDGPWSVNACAPVGCVYDNVSENSRTNSLMITPVGESQIICGRFQVTQDQENDNVTPQWSSTNPPPQRQFETSMFPNDSSETKTESGFYAPGPTAMPDNVPQGGASNYSEDQLVTDSKDMTSSPVGETVNSGTLNFLMDVPCYQPISKDGVNEVPFSNSHLQRYCVTENHSTSEASCDTRAPGSFLGRFSDSSFNSTPSKDDEENENSMSCSLVGSESDEGSGEEYIKPSQTSTGQKQTKWSTENIQNELEMLEERRTKVTGPMNSAQERLENYKFKTIAKSKESSLVNVDYMICNGVTVAGFKPRAIIRKRNKVNIPSDTKDQCYWQKRRKNNDSAKKSRELKKEKEKNFYRRALELEYENIYLHECLALAEAELAAVGRRIPAPPMNSSAVY